MAIDYASGSGIFDKIGALIHAVNIIETFETGTLQTKLSAIQAKLETTNDYDDQARRLFYQIDNEEKSSLRSWKQDMIALVQPLLTQEMNEAETYFSQDINDLLKYLVFCMRRDSASVDGSTITFTGPAAGSPSPTGNFSLLASKYYPTVQGADSSSQQNGIIWQNSYRVICTDITTAGAELFRIEGDLPLGGKSHPNWMYAGNAGTLRMISSISNTLVSNGGFENLNSAGNSFSNWALTTGTYTTDIVRDATPYRGTYSCKLVNSAKITQVMNTSVLKPWTKYLITYKAKKSAAGSDGTLKVGFTGTSGLYDQKTVNSDLTTSFALYSYFFNTGADPRAITDFIVERTGSTTAAVYIDEVTLSEVPLVHGLGMAVVAGSTDAAIDDFWTVTPTNNGEGTIMTFFGRWFDLLLPGNTGGAETIADSIAE